MCVDVQAVGSTATTGDDEEDIHSLCECVHTIYMYRYTYMYIVPLYIHVQCHAIPTIMCVCVCVCVCVCSAQGDACSVDQLAGCCHDSQGCLLLLLLKQHLKKLYALSDR